MRRLLDYTRSGRWLTLNADPDAAPARGDEGRSMERQISERPEIRIEHAEDIPVAPIRRLFEYTISGRWRSPDQGTLESAASDEARQQLCDDAFFGLEVKEIPAEKWREIAPLFQR
ncbi:MAG: hypothetical protein JWN73_4372 [Betaproteobacteria bacterium]|nr:hypothetical protein [Betaproteobacteria bacterium]